VVLMGLAITLVPRVNDRVMQVHRDVVHYAQGDNLNEQNLGSQGTRLDYWARSLDMVQAHPLTGVGMGAWRQHYLSLGGLQQAAPSNPHHQYLLMASEGGLVALALLLTWMALLWQSAATTASPSAMKGVVLLAVVVSLFNCPFYGVGMGEMLLLLFATLLQPRAHQA
jgi:O-antigen ligase